jgi:hypothetical protein
LLTFKAARTSAARLMFKVFMFSILLMTKSSPREGLRRIGPGYRFPSSDGRREV